ncbi:hypothetical protein [Ktedonobacter racemifer]|uniref:hypothetical protein n=1 Tax=Ktedonobacter racemifer TaxID=363277 RepID=UPI0012FA0FC2|nr:hypothetical protein [Ktedonobacter racemifer]
MPPDPATTNAPQLEALHLDVTKPASHQRPTANQERQASTRRTAAAGPPERQPEQPDPPRQKATRHAPSEPAGPPPAERTHQPSEPTSQPDPPRQKATPNASEPPQPGAAAAGPPERQQPQPDHLNASSRRPRRTTPASEPASQRARSAPHHDQPRPREAARRATRAAKSTRK